MPYKDPEEARKSVIEYRRTHREILRKRSRQYLEANRNSVNAYQKKYREANRDKLRAKQNGNPQYSVKRNAIRRLRIEATIEGETTIADFVKMVRRSRIISCYYCDEMISGKKAHIEHVIPLARGGSHRPDNLCASCPACNLSKQTKTLTEWKPKTSQQILPI